MPLAQRSKALLCMASPHENERMRVSADLPDVEVASQIIRNWPEKGSLKNPWASRKYKSLEASPADDYQSLASCRGHPP